jgi:hypothetical protein
MEGHQKNGLPTSLDDEVLVGLSQLMKFQSNFMSEFWDRKSLAFRRPLPVRGDWPGIRGMPRGSSPTGFQPLVVQSPSRFTTKLGWHQASIESDVMKG